jgi:hypothetical protein
MGGADHFGATVACGQARDLTRSGRWWFGNITPPVPTRIREVAAAADAASAAGADPATPGTLWCSDTQNR